MPLAKRRRGLNPKRAVKGAREAALILTALVGIHPDGGERITETESQGGAICQCWRIRLPLMGLSAKRKAADFWIICFHASDYRPNFNVGCVGRLVRSICCSSWDNLVLFFPRALPITT